MMQYQFRPIHEWPGTKTNPRKRSPFDVTWSRTLQDLDRELRHLKAEGLIIQCAVKESEIRLDGMMRSDARPAWPGVILTFDSKHGPQSYPCDTYSDWQANVRAIGLALTALRAVDRYGVSNRGEQYKGWARLEAPRQSMSESLLTALYLLVNVCGNTVNGVDPAAIMRDRDRHKVDSLYRQAVFLTHPDQGGNVDTFRKVQEAKAVLDRWLAV